MRGTVASPLLVPSVFGARGARQGEHMKGAVASPFLNVIYFI